MKLGSRYLKIIEWSDEDGCYIGSCPELFHGGCHGDDDHEVFDHLCRIIEETIEIYRREGKSLPKPLVNRSFVNCLQKIASSG